MGTAILVRTDYSSKECRGLARRLKGTDLVRYHSRERVRSLAGRLHPCHRNWEFVFLSFMTAFAAIL